MSMQVSYKKQILFFLLGFLIILTSIEIGARVYEQAVEDCFYLNSDATKNLDFEFKKKMCQQSELVQVIEFPVFTYEPNQDLMSIHINSFGFRGNEFSLEKDPNTYRIFMVGGSTIFGSGATSDEKTIPAQLEKNFSENGYQVEIINAGVGAADSREEAYKIRYMYKQFQPDLFIIYDGWNDSFKKLEKSELNPEISRMEEVNSKKSFLQLWISENLDVYRTVYLVYPIIMHNLIASSLNDEIHLKNSEIWSQRWSDVCMENNQENIDTIILLQPVVGTGTKSLSNDEKRHAEYIKAIKTNEQLEFFSKQLPIESCTASFDMRNAMDNEIEPVFYDGGHMNDLGNEIMADAIYEKILPFIFNTPESNQMTVKTNMD